MSSVAGWQKEWGKGWDKIAKHQQELAKVKGKFVHQKGPHDAIVSRAIPLGLSAVGAVLVVRGVYHMIFGIGKEE